MKSSEIFKRFRKAVNEKIGISVDSVEMPNHKTGKLDQIEKDLILFEKYKNKILDMEKNQNKTLDKTPTEEELLW